ncbi:MAG: peptidase associated/transthyretin-like domain-containing protein, partial [Planctomycetota bacterium]
MGGMNARWLTILVLLAVVAAIWLLGGPGEEAPAPPEEAAELTDEVVRYAVDPPPLVEGDEGFVYTPVDEERWTRGEPADEPDAAEEPAPEIRLAVKVTWPGGEPVEGATVTVREHFVYREHFGGPVKASPSERARKSTDANGMARLTFRRERLHGVQVMVSAYGHAARTKTLYLDAGATEIRLALAPCPPVRIAMVDGEGDRIRGAHVRLIAPDTASSAVSSIGPYGFEVFPVKRGDGYFEFPPVAPERSWHRDGPALLVTAYASGFLPLAEYVLYSTIERGEVELRMVRPVTVRGRCIDGDGRPVAGVRVEGVKTGEDGVFEVTGFPETGGEILVSPPEMIPFRAKVPPADGPVVDIGDLLLRMGDLIHGSVVDEFGKPVAGASVRVWPEALGPRAARYAGTSGSGAFCVR